MLTLHRAELYPFSPSLSFRLPSLNILMEQELKRFPSLQSAIAAASYEALEKFCEEGRQTVLRLMDMEASYLTVDFFRKLPQEVDKGGEMQQLHLL